MTFWWTTFTPKARNVKVGQTLHILGHDFHVVGIVEHGKSARLFVLISTLQEMMGAHDKASVFFIKADRSDHAAAVQDEVKQLLPGYEVRLPKESYVADDVVKCAISWAPS